MYPETGECPKLPYEGTGKDHLFYDLIYNPEETEFLKRGKAYCAVTKNGKEMLELQADRSWEIWME